MVLLMASDKWLIRKNYSIGRFPYWLIVFVIFSSFVNWLGFFRLVAGMTFLLAPVILYYSLPGKKELGKYLKFIYYIVVISLNLSVLVSVFDDGQFHYIGGHDWKRNVVLLYVPLYLLCCKRRMDKIDYILFFEAFFLTLIFSGRVQITSFLLLFLMLVRKNFSKSVIVILCSVGILVVLTYLGDIYNTRFGELTEYMVINDNAVPRVRMFLDVIELSLGVFPFSLGSGAFGGAVASKWYSPYYLQLNYDHLHGLSPLSAKSGANYLSDSYLTFILAELGFVGLAVFLVRIFAKVKGVKGNRLQLASFVFILALNSLSTPLFANPLGLLLFVPLIKHNFLYHE